MGFFDANRLKRRTILPGIKMGSVHLKHLMLTHFTFEAGSAVPDHAHLNEQITLIISGELEFTLNGETRIVRAGEGATVPSNTTHRVRAITDVVAVDCWHPVREDYIIPDDPSQPAI